jgi:UDPglucose 6-dehydrogenase
MNIINIGIIGNGFVGKATALFASVCVKVLIYDIDPDKCCPPGTTLKQICDKCDLIFICVPTPVKTNGECYLNIVESVVKSIRKEHKTRASIVLRSTVPPGTCKRLKVHHMPEFLRELTWAQDFRETTQWVIGSFKPDPIFTKRITNLLQGAVRDKNVKSNEIYWGTSTETELVKYTRNAFLATKLSFFNEIEEYARKIHVNYDWLRELITVDPRIGGGHTRVPGSDGLRGFGGTCFPKDLTTLETEMKKVGMKPIITKAVLERNNTIDRPLKDWENKVGRSIIHEKEDEKE